MLRINLLPSYVAQRRLTRKLIAAYLGAFLVVVAGLLAFQFLYLQPELTKETNDATSAVAAKAAIDQLNAQAATITTGVAPIQAKLDFVNAVAAYNQQYIKLYTTVAQYTSPKILYSGMTVSGSTLTINAYTPSIADLGRYLQIMYTEPDFSSITVSAIPGGAAAAKKLYYYKGVLIGVEGGTTPGKSTFPGVPPEVQFTLPKNAQVPTQIGQSGIQGGASSFGGPSQYGGGGPSQYGGPPASFGRPGFGGPGAGPQTPWDQIQAEPNFDPKAFQVKVQRTDGFIFTATATLKQAFSPPAPPGGGGAAAGGAAYGYPGGGG